MYGIDKIFIVKNLPFHVCSEPLDSPCEDVVICATVFDDINIVDSILCKTVTLLQILMNINKAGKVND